ncbi:MAG: hypothetical protein ACK44N_11080 [Bacteroidota bacterium]|jgi:hypothetical protein
MKKILFLLLFTPVFAFAQSDTIATIPFKDEPADVFTAGLGFGQDLGGIGANLTYYATNRLGFQGGLGYARAGIGYNAALKYRFLNGETLSKRTVYLIGMYGYIATIKVDGNASLNKIFIGPSFGLGFDSKAFGSSHTYWSFALLVPFIGNKIQNYIEQNKIRLSHDFYPVTLSISYKIIIR